MEKRELLYTGKAKSVYSTDNPDLMVLEFRNDTSAFDGKRIEQLDRKGHDQQQVQRLYHAKAGRSRHSYAL